MELLNFKVQKPHNLQIYCYHSDAFNILMCALIYYWPKNVPLKRTITLKFRKANHYQFCYI